MDAVGDLTGILTADPHAEYQPARTEGGQVGQLPGDHQRVTQRQQVDADADPEPLGGAERHGRLDQPVDPGADVKAHVIAITDVVESSRLGQLQSLAVASRVVVGESRHQTDPWWHSSPLIRLPRR
jgi:hypothetical protein